MTNKWLARPKITLLNQEQIDRIHMHSLQILSRAGIRLDSNNLLKMLTKKLGVGLVKGNQVHFPQDVVNWAIDVAPPSVEIYDRHGNIVFELGNNRTRFGAGVTTLHYKDPAMDEIMPFHRDHMRLGARLVERLPNFDVISTLGVLQDVPPQLADLYGTLEMLANTHKPMVLLISEAASFPLVLDMIEELHGDLHPAPIVIPYFNPITPLLINPGTADKMLVAIKRQLPFIFSSYGMLGASTPMSLADTLTLLNAELLAGLTLTQLIKEGSPIILGPMPAIFDMKTLVSFYDPSSMVLNLAFAEMMAHYKIPHCGTSGSTTGWDPDIVSASEMMMNHLSSLMGKVGLAPFVGSLHDGKVFSPLNMVHADEIIAQALRFSKGFHLEINDAALHEILQVGPGGSFLSTDRTLDLFRTVIRESEFFPRWGFEKWQEVGKPQYIEILRARTLDLINTLEPPTNYEDLIRRGEELIDRYTANPIS